MSLKGRFLTATILTAAVFFIAPCIGMECILPFEIGQNTLKADIFFRLRLPRVITAFFAGAGLSLCGMVFQALFRNPLAGPFTLGISSGASCGAALTVVLGGTGAILGIPIVTFGAFGGSITAIVLLFGFASLRRSTDKLTILLAGVTLSYLFSSLLMFFQYLSNPNDSFFIIRWLMGGLETIGYRSLFTFIPFEILAGIIIFSQLTPLDHLLTGDDIAQSRGIDIKKTRTLLLIGTTLLVGALVAVCGPIGFIGLMVPHICRSLFSWRHTINAPATVLCGGTLLMISDTIARSIIAPTEIPVGVITALLGTPFFLWILFHRNENGRRNEF
jgi:iron complex transport system permease protein